MNIVLTKLVKASMRRDHTCNFEEDYGGVAVQQGMEVYYYLFLQWFKLKLSSASLIFPILRWNGIINRNCLPEELCAVWAEVCSNGLWDHKKRAVIMNQTKYLVHLTQSPVSGLYPRLGSLGVKQEQGNCAVITPKKRSLHPVLCRSGRQDLPGHEVFFSCRIKHLTCRK